MALVVTLLLLVAEGIDTNDVYSPCLDSKIQRSDGFTFGVAFSSKESFFQDQIQFSPCDARLSLASKNAQLAVFRPKVDQLSFLTIDTSTFNPVCVSSYLLSSCSSLLLLLFISCYIHPCRNGFCFSSPVFANNVTIGIIYYFGISGFKILYI